MDSGKNKGWGKMGENKEGFGGGFGKGGGIVNNNKALSILVDKNGVTVGCKISLCGEIRNISRENLARLCSMITMSNAIITKKGYVRGKAGVNLPKEELMERKERYTSEILLYHGSRQSILVPKFGVGKINNDYGQGFYTTMNKELAKEWAWSSYSLRSSANVHAYKLNTAGLKVIDLTKYDSLYWLAEIIANRTMSTDDNEVLTERYLPQFLKTFKMDTSKADIIIGYRADNSYFRYAKDFIENRVYKFYLDKALRIGHSELQVCLKSKEAFRKLKVVGTEKVPEEYKDRFMQRDKLAREQYNSVKIYEEKLTFADIIGGNH